MSGRTLSTNLSDEQMAAFDHWVDQTGAVSRSELLRRMIIKGLAEREFNRQLATEGDLTARAYMMGIDPPSANSVGRHRADAKRRVVST
jgi:metal-responsive CopG/Arc/MetJ family transcriptional regulator